MRRRRAGAGGYCGLALVGGAVGAECAEGGGVGAALGGEVAAEAEHVRPGGQPQVLQLGELPRRRHSAMSRRAWSRMGRSARSSAGLMRRSRVPVAFGGLGGVLGDVARRPRWSVRSPVGGDRAGVELAAPGAACGRARRGGRDGRRWTARAACAMASVSRSAVAQAGGAVAGPSGPSRRMIGVEVDDAAALVFGDLGEGEPGLGGERLAGQPGAGGRASRRRVMVKRRHSSGAQALNSTEPV